MKGSTASYVQTKQQCITFMKEYAERSLEELRYEDYAANRKGPQAGPGGMFGGTQAGGVFGSTMQQPQANSLFGQQQQPAQQTTGLFGTAQNTLGGGNTFGQPTSAFGQQNTGGLFGKPLTTPATTSSAFSAFGANTSTFGGGAKPFGAVQGTSSTGLFGQPAASAFGAPSANTFGATPGFGQQAQPAQNNSLFGSNQATAAPAFGLGSAAPASTGFGFGQTNTNANTGLFGGAKPTFNAAPAFGAAQPSTSTTGFAGFGQPGGANLFNQAKPSTGFGTFGQPQTQTTPSVSFGQNTGGSLFGGAAQPSGGLFGGSNTNSGGLFGGTNNAFGGGNTSLPFGQQQPGGLFGG